MSTQVAAAPRPPALARRRRLHRSVRRGGYIEVARGAAGAEPPGEDAPGSAELVERRGGGGEGRVVGAVEFGGRVSCVGGWYEQWGGCPLLLCGGNRAACRGAVLAWVVPVWESAFTGGVMRAHMMQHTRMIRVGLTQKLPHD